jgi:hypothetical protein
MNSYAFLNRIRLVLIATLTTVFLMSCASGPDIKTDYDHSIDFSQYKTYGFFNPMGIENPNYSSIFGQVFRDAISSEMNQRGYTQSDNPDLMINVSARLQDKTKVTTTSDPYMGAGYYGYRGGRYGTWGGYGYGTSTHVSQYTEGTVNVDMVDDAQKRMVWEGVAIGRVKEDRDNAETRVAIKEGVAEMFAGYPFRAGR